jgi:hypothetical protein
MPVTDGNGIVSKRVSRPGQGQRRRKMPEIALRKNPWIVRFLRWTLGADDALSLEQWAFWPCAILQIPMAGTRRNK